MPSKFLTTTGSYESEIENFQPDRYVMINKKRKLEAVVLQGTADPDLTVPGNLVVNGTTTTNQVTSTNLRTPTIDTATAIPLEVGPTNANQVNLAKTGVITEVKDDLNIIGNVIGQGTLITPVMGFGHLENILVHSQEFQSVWSGISVTQNDSIAPDGTVTADKIQLAFPTADFIQTVPSMVASNIYTFTLWAKTVSGSSIQISLSIGNVGSVAFQVAGEWQKLRYTSAAGPDKLVKVVIPNANLVHVWGAQLVNGPDEKPYVITKTVSIGSIGIGTNITSSLKVGGALTTTDTTSSSTTSTGALIVDGGVGIGGNVNIGGALDIAKNNVAAVVKVLGTTASTTTTNGALIVSGGMGIGGDLNIGGALDIGKDDVSAVVNVLGTNPSTTTTDGALVVSGGVGIADNLNVGGTVKVPSQILDTAGNNLLAYLKLKSTTEQTLTTGVFTSVVMPETPLNTGSGLWTVSDSSGTLVTFNVAGIYSIYGRATFKNAADSTTRSMRLNVQSSGGAGVTSEGIVDTIANAIVHTTIETRYTASFGIGGTARLVVFQTSGGNLALSPNYFPAELEIYRIG